MTEYHLYVGNRRTGIVVRSDERYPSMFRIHRPNHSPSDIVNLARAKDAALAFAHRSGSEDFNWSKRQTSVASPPMR